MSEQPHSVAIGAFIIGALLILASALLLIRGSGLGIDRERAVMVFDGSVKGLTIGAPVALRGVQIGQVTDIDLIFDTDSVDVITLVEADIRTENIQRRGSKTGEFAEEMISRGLRAQLNSQSLLTGLLYIQLDFHPDSELVLVDVDTPHIQIPTIPTDLQRITRQIEAIDFAQVASDLQATVEGLRQFAGSESFQAFPEKIDEALRSIRELSDQLKVQLASTGPRLDTLLDNTTETVTTVNRELPRLSGSARATLAQMDRAIIATEQAMTDARGLIAEDSPTTYQLNKALRELALAGRALQSLAKTLEEQPEALLRGKRNGS